MGFVAFLVLPELLRPQRTLPSDTWWRELLVHNIDQPGHGSDLLIVHTAADSSRDMTASPFAAVTAPQPGQPQDYNKLFKAERDNLEFSEGLYSWVGKDVDNRVLQKYGKIAA